ncbi:MAG: LacI family DNA-binding transcriptional regulator, partial [Candidatus Promineifilaceae bacterium]
ALNILRKTFAQTFFQTACKGLQEVMTTIKDVANRAGVSISTVSHVINNSRAVSEESRQRVEEAMAELDYQPNTLARSLRRQQTQSIGMIVPDIANPFFAEIARGIEDSSFQQNYSIILCNSEGDLEKQVAYTNLLIQNQVAGIVFVAAGVSTELVEDLQHREVPLVVVDRAVPRVEVNSVMTNHNQGGRLATQHLIDLGHRRIACISAGSGLSPSADRVTGYMETLWENNMPVNKKLIMHGDFQYESGYKAVHTLLDLPEPPTAVFACNDLMAVGCISAAAERGLRVPQDLSVVGFDNVRLASFTNPPLTTVSQPMRQIGTLALELLMERINDIDSPVRIEQLDTELVVRRTTAAPRHTD